MLLNPAGELIRSLLKKMKMLHDDPEQVVLKFEVYTVYQRGI